MKRGLKIALRVGIGVGLAVALFLLYAVVIEPRLLLDERLDQAEVPNLPARYEGATIALFADLQVGMWLDNLGMIERVIERTVERDPALVLIAGDFVYAPDDEVIETAVELVRPLAESGVPTFAVLGNHDYSLMTKEAEARVGIADRLTRALEAAGIRVLENEAVAVPGSGSADEPPLYVVGVGSAWAGRADVTRALSEVPEGAPRIVLMHNAIGFRDIKAGEAPLTLAAHTHGGQLRLPLMPSESWLKIALPTEVVADGWAEEGTGAAGNRLYVNRGIGFSVVPMRVNCRPELTFFTLRRSAGDLPSRGPG